MPSLSVVQTLPSRRRNDAPGALLAAEADRAVEQPGHEPLEPDRHLQQRAAEVGGHPVDHRRRHQRLADRGAGRPAGAVAEEVRDRHGQVVVGVHQAGVGRDDAVPVGVGVVAGRDLVVVLAGDQRRHRVRRRAVHPDLAVPVERHEPERRVDVGVDDGQVEPVPVGDLAPVGDARAAQRVGADPHPRLADRVEVDDRGQVVDVGAEEVVRAGGVGGPRALVRDPLDVLEPGGEERVGPVLDPAGHVGVGRAAVGRVVLEPAVVGRVVRRGDDDAVGGAARSVVGAVGAVVRAGSRATATASGSARRGCRPAR